MAKFQSSTGAPATLAFGSPISRTIPIAPDDPPFSFDIDAQPGRHSVVLHSDAKRLIVPGDSRNLVFSILNLQETEANTDSIQ